MRSYLSFQSDKVDRLLLAAIVVIHIASLLVHSLLSLLVVPLYALLYERLVIMMARLLGMSCLAPRFIVLDDRVYFTKIGISMYVYKIEPLVSCERLEPHKLWSLLQDLIKRLISANVHVGFARLSDGTKYFILLYKGRELDLEKTVLQILSELFLVKKLTKHELKCLFSFRELDLKQTLLLLLPLLSFTIYFPFTIVIILLALFIIRRVRDRMILSDRFIIDSHSLRSLRHNAVMYTKVDYSAVKTLMLTISRSRSSYLLLFASNPALKDVLEEELHKAQETLVVKERGRAYVRLLGLKNAAERMASGEVALTFSLLVSSEQVAVPFTFGPGAVYDIFVRQEPALSGDVIPLIPLYGGSLTIDRISRYELYLGVDKHDREVKIDLKALPSCHMLIIGPSGMGKTWTARTIIKKLLSRGINVIIVDPHGEYARYFPELKHVRIPDTLPNIFEVHEVSKSERIHKLLKAFEPYLDQQCLAELYDALTYIYSRGLHTRPRDALKEIQRFLSSSSLGRVFVERICELYESTEIIDIRELTRHCIIDLSRFLSSPDLLQLFSVLIVDLLYTYLASRGGGDDSLSLIFVDEAYFVLSSPLTELMIRGFRKFNVGLVLITQTLTSIPSDSLQNIGMFIVLGGSDTYVSSIASYFDLSEEDVEWLLGSVPPSINKKVRALLIVGPIKRHVVIELM